MMQDLTAHSVPAIFCLQCAFDSLIILAVLFDYLKSSNPLVIFHVFCHPQLLLEPLVPPALYLLPSMLYK